MNNVDEALERLARAPVPAGLLIIEQAVLDRVRGDRHDAFHNSGTVRAAVILGALVVGIAGGTIPSKHAHPGHGLAPFGSAAELAPSTLLDVR